MRMRWCRAALRAFLRRWGAYLATGAVVIVAGMPGSLADAVTVVRALCAWLVLPLFSAVVEPAWAVPATLLQAVATAGLVWGMRPLLWPEKWAEAERALPLSQRDTIASDAVVVALGLAPAASLYAIGAQALIANDPAWLHAFRARAVLALGVALVAAVALGVGLLQGLRFPRRHPSWRYRWLTGDDRLCHPRLGNGLRGPGRNLRAGSVRVTQSPRAAPAGADAPSQPAEHGASSKRIEPVTAALASVHTGALRVLVWWPLWRGPAKRSGRALCVGLVSLCCPALGMLRWPHGAGWWLGAYALIALIMVTRVNGLMRLELGAWQEACAPLPLRAATLRRSREWMALSPLLSSAWLLLACLPHAGVRPGVLAVYLVVCAGSCFVEVRSAAPDAAAKSSRWLFCIALMLALASEVMA